MQMSSKPSVKSLSYMVRNVEPILDDLGILTKSELDSTVETGMVKLTDSLQSNNANSVE